MTQKRGGNPPDELTLDDIGRVLIGPNWRNSMTYEDRAKMEESIAERGRFNNKIDWVVWEPFLGVWTDARIARAAGCSKQMVQKRRKSLGILPGVMPHVEWIRWDGRLGREPDDVLAQRIGCSEATVRRRRRKMGIPEFHDLSELDTFFDSLEIKAMREELEKQKQELERIQRRFFESLPREITQSMIAKKAKLEESVKQMRNQILRTWIAVLKGLRSQFK